MRTKPVPLAMAASTKGGSRRRQARGCGRGARRAAPRRAVMATMTFSRLARVKRHQRDARAGIDGIDISPSMTRMTIASVQRHEAGDQSDREPDPASPAVATLIPTDQRHPRSVDRAAVDVAPEHVGAEPILQPTAGCRRLIGDNACGSIGPAATGQRSRSATMPTQRCTPPMSAVGWRLKASRKRRRGRRYRLGRGDATGR